MSPLALGFSYRSMLDLRRISQLALAFTVLVGAPVAAAWHWQCPDGGRCIQGEDAAYYCPPTEEAAASCCKPAVITRERCAHGHLPEARQPDASPTLRATPHCEYNLQANGSRPATTANRVVNSSGPALTAERLQFRGVAHVVHRLPVDTNTSRAPPPQFGPAAPRAPPSA